MRSPLASLALALAAGLLGLALATRASAVPAVPLGDEDWAAVWARARALHDSEASLAGQDDPDPEALAANQSSAEELARVAQAHPGDGRAELLLAWLARREGSEHALVVPREWPWAGAENWIAAYALEPGPQRTQALVRALEAQELEPTRAELLLAWNAGLQYATDLLWMDEAAAVQRALHARYEATWSAMNLAYTLHRGGDWEGADAVLERSLERASEQGLSAAERADLWNNRGLIATGAGQERLGLDCLGRALGLGSQDAALILARRELFEGRLEQARAGFRGLLLAPEPHAWTLRGWGVSLLQRPGVDGRADEGADR